jgi:hypothetical protein
MTIRDFALCAAPRFKPPPGSRIWGNYAGQSLVAGAARLPVVLAVMIWFSTFNSGNTGSNPFGNAKSFP